MERREDVLLQTLRRYIEELGGLLDISVHLPGETIRLTPFSSPQLAAPSPPAHRGPRLPPLRTGALCRMKFFEIQSYHSATILQRIKVPTEYEECEETPAEGSTEPLRQRRVPCILLGENHVSRLHYPARFLSLHGLFLRGSLCGNQATSLPRGGPAPLVSTGAHRTHGNHEAMVRGLPPSERPRRGGSVSPAILRRGKPPLPRRSCLLRCLVFARGNPGARRRRLRRPRDPRRVPPGGRGACFLGCDGFFPYRGWSRRARLGRGSR
jgi:hypothetical protein